MADDQKINLRCVLTSSKEGVPLRLLAKDYRQLVSSELGLQGHPTLTAYLRSIPDVVRLSNVGGEIVCHGVASERSSHIEALISRQRTAKKKQSRGRRVGRGRRASRCNSGLILCSDNSDALSGRVSMASASSFSSFSAASAFPAFAYRNRTSVHRGLALGGGGSSRRPLQEQQIYLPPALRANNSAASDDKSVQNLSITPQSKPVAPQPPLAAVASADFADLLAAARKLLQPRGTERNYFWRQAADQSGVAPPAQWETLEASLLAEGALRIEDVLGRLMYYPGDPVAASGSMSSCPAATLDDSVLIPTPTAPRTPIAVDSPRLAAASASTSADAEKAAEPEVDEWGFEIGDNTSEADFYDDGADGDGDGEFEDADEEADAFLNVAELTEGQQFTALFLGSDGDKLVWLYTLDSQLEAMLEAVMKEATVLLRFLRTRKPQLYAMYCLATMPEEVLDQQLLLFEPEDGMELLRCRLASDEVSEAAVKIQLSDQSGPPIEVPIFRLRRFSTKLIAELGCSSAPRDVLASLIQIPDAVVQVACQNPPQAAVKPELHCFLVEFTAPDLLLRHLAPR